MKTKIKVFPSFKQKKVQMPLNILLKAVDIFLNICIKRERLLFFCCQIMIKMFKIYTFHTKLQNIYILAASPCLRARYIAYIKAKYPINNLIIVKTKKKFCQNKKNCLVNWSFHPLKTKNPSKPLPRHLSGNPLVYI